MEAGLEGNSLVKSTRYLIVIFFQGGIFRPNRPVFNLMIPYWLDTLLLTQEKEKSSPTGPYVLKHFFLTEVLNLVAK